MEVTFSRNRIQGNLITECTYGIWGRYRYQTVLTGNLITNCRTGVAIEHGQLDTIRQNLFSDDSTGIQLWRRAEQPQAWGYAQKRDTRSRDHSIDQNVFANVRKPLKISVSQNVSVNGENLFFNFDQLLTVAQPNEKQRDTLNNSQLVIRLLGSRGTWRLVKRQGISRVSEEQGQVPARITLEPDGSPGSLEFEYTGDQATMTEFRERIPAGKSYKFEFKIP